MGKMKIEKTAEDGVDYGMEYMPKSTVKVVVEFESNFGISFLVPFPTVIILYSLQIVF